MHISSLSDDLNQIKFVTLMDTSKFPSFTENFSTDSLQNLKQYYPNKFSDMQLQRLKSQLHLIHDDE